MATLTPEQIDALMHAPRVCAALAGELATTAARVFGRLQGLLEAAVKRPFEGRVEGAFERPGEVPLHRAGLAAGCVSNLVEIFWRRSPSIGIWA